MATRTAGALGGNWNVATTWNEVAVPTAADDVVLDSSSGNVTLPGLVTCVCRSIDCTGYTGTLTKNASSTFNIGDGTAGAGNVALKFVAGMTYTDNSTGAINFISTSTTQQTVDMGGKTTAAMKFNGAGGSWLLNSGVTTTGTFEQAAGTLDTGNQAISCARFLSSTGSRVLTLGSSTITCTGTAPLNITAAGGLTVNAGTSTFVISDVSATNKTIGTTGVTFYNLSITTGGAGFVQFDGGTFNRLLVSGGSTKTVRFEAGSTVTLTGGADAFFSGAASNLITCVSHDGANPWNLSKASVDLSSNYLSISRCTMAGGAKLYCGVNSTDGGNNNANVVFTAPPSSLPPGTSKTSIILGISL